MDIVKYHHACNRHTPVGATAALSKLLDEALPDSLLDVGCGTGTWLRAALDLGIKDVRGIDGVVVPPDELQVSSGLIAVHDLRADWPVSRRFDLVLCLEVAEHLPADAAAPLVRKLTACGDRIFFSAANPWQGGENHIHGKWPTYWQELFNAEGFACWDSLRWKIWDNTTIEPWYRQNMFLAQKDELVAGTEPRIPGVIHPDGMRSACHHWRYRNQSLLEALARGIDRPLRRALRMREYE